MEIYRNSEHLESTAREIASQTQARAQVVEVPFRQDAQLETVDHGDILITVIKGNGLIKAEESEHALERNDQVLLTEGDCFSLLPASDNDPFVVQIYWAPSIDI